MKIYVELNETDKGTPIEFAGAIINYFEDRYGDKRAHAYNCLAAISKHIGVYLEHDDYGLEVPNVIKGFTKG